jgi:hypothetical protein
MLEDRFRAFDHDLQEEMLKDGKIVKSKTCAGFAQNDWPTLTVRSVSTHAYFRTATLEWDLNGGLTKGYSDAVAL